MAARAFGQRHGDRRTRGCARALASREARASAAAKAQKRARPAGRTTTAIGISQAKASASTRKAAPIHQSPARKKPKPKPQPTTAAGSRRADDAAGFVRLGAVDQPDEHRDREQQHGEQVERRECQRRCGAGDDGDQQAPPTPQHDDRVGEELHERLSRLRWRIGASSDSRRRSARGQALDGDSGVDAVARGRRVSGARRRPLGGCARV